MSAPLAERLTAAAREAGLRIETNPEDLLAPHPATAAFDETGAYRYLLTRTWGTGDPAVFVMLNPSTADAFTLDPTVRRCVGFARAWGAGGLVVANIFALRSTDPQALYDHPDPVGAANDAVLDALPVGPRVIAAWGAHGALHGRGHVVAERLTAAGHRLYCLGRTSKGSPRHPLYLRADSAPLGYISDPAPGARTANETGPSVGSST